MTRSVDVRHELSQALRLDLVGPGPDDTYSDEVLTEAPSAWYLTGFLVPFEAEEDQRRGDDADEQIDVAEGGGLDDADDGERASARNTYFASSIGLSAFLPPAAEYLDATVTWGDYQPEKPPEGDSTRGRYLWGRIQRTERVRLPLEPDSPAHHHDVPDSRGLRLVIYCRTLAAHGDLQGHLSVSVFLVNQRPPEPKKYAARPTTTNAWPICTTATWPSMRSAMAWPLTPTRKMGFAVT